MDKYLHDRQMALLDMQLMLVERQLRTADIEYEYWCKKEAEIDARLAALTEEKNK
jgi:hypothetical protein